MARKGSQKVQLESPPGESTSHLPWSTTVARHTVVGASAAALVFLFWESRPEWDSEMRLWKALGDAGFVLLIVTLAAGPAARLWPTARRLLRWRRHLGIWFALLVLAHGTLILNGWAQWDIQRFWGYEFVPQLGRLVRLEPGFGLANLLGLVALFWALVLLATSSDRVVNYLGYSAWKWVQNGAYIIFYLVVLHAVYFLFIHYTLSFHRDVPEPDWFRYPFLMLAGLIPALQLGAFVRTVGNKKSREPRPT
jgi:methionine sulfoxide reductase heme-binding subunit